MSISQQNAALSQPFLVCVRANKLKIVQINSAPLGHVLATSLNGVSSPGVRTDANNYLTLWPNILPSRHSEDPKSMSIIATPPAIEIRSLNSGT